MVEKRNLGHLIDSAANNHQRFIRRQLAPELTLPGYDQDAWVQAYAYQQSNWTDLVTPWTSYNLHLAAVIHHNIDPACAGHVWHRSQADHTLAFLADDYVVHLQHHLAQLGVA